MGRGALAFGLVYDYIGGAADLADMNGGRVAALCAGTVDFDSQTLVLAVREAGSRIPASPQG